MSRGHGNRGRRDRRGQRGATLVIAMVILGLLATIVPVTLALAQVGSRTSSGVSEDRADTYAATSGIEAAVQYARRTAWVGRFGAPCPTISTQVGDTPVSVTCTSSTGPFDLDRSVAFSATVGGRTAATASVRYRDATAGGGLPSVDVLSWSASPGTPT